MKFSLAWLGRYVDVADLPLQEVLERFTLSIAEIEGTETITEPRGHIVTGRIGRAEPHPRRGSLSVCSVDVGGGKDVQVVCGAGNARAGLVTAYAAPGSIIGGKEIGAREFAGVMSEGMLCSPAELDLTGDGDGICDFGANEAGLRLESLLPVSDTLIDVDNKSLTHRPDLWGHIGIARELAALFRRQLHLPAVAERLDASPLIALEIRFPKDCPRYTALSMGALSIAPSPLWMQTFLHRCGVRAINNVIDVTNFVMLETGQPLHAFDAREVLGNHIVVRRAEAGEKLVTLDDLEREMAGGELLICDAERPIGIAGIMGLANSEVRDDTHEIVLEAANFEASKIRRSAIGLGLRTEASARFEKSLDARLADFAARRFVAVVTEVLPTATVLSDLADAWPVRPKPIEVETRVSYISQRLGTSIAREDMHDLFERLEFGVTNLDEDCFKVSVPSFRATGDIAIPEDLVEEVGRHFGYDNIEPVQPVTQVRKPYRHPDRIFHKRIRLCLSAMAGYTEIQTYSFDHEQFLQHSGLDGGERIEVVNPISADLRFLRRSLLPRMLSFIEQSLPYESVLQVYEIGRVFLPRAADSKSVAQPFNVAMGTWQRHERGDVSAVVAAQRRAFAELKGALELLLSHVRVEARFRAHEGGAVPGINPGRCADVVATTGERLGYLGAIHPRVAGALDFGVSAAFAELDLERLRGLHRHPPLFQPIPDVPAVPYDISIIVPQEVRHAALVERIISAHPDWIRLVRLIDVYRGPGIPADSKSMTFHLVFQSDERTLKLVEVNEVVELMINDLAAKFGAQLRSDAESESRQ